MPGECRLLNEPPRRLLSILHVPASAPSTGRPKAGRIFRTLHAETVAQASRGYDAGKHVNGRKRHIAVDTIGLLLVVAVSAASVQGRHAGHALIWAPRTCYGRISHVWAGGGYNGTLVGFALTQAITKQIVTKIVGQVGFHVQPRRWVVERTLAWITRCRRTVRDYERLPQHHATIVQWSMIIIMTRRLARQHPS